MTQKIKNHRVFMYTIVFTGLFFMAILATRRTHSGMAETFAGTSVCRRRERRPMSGGYSQAEFPKEYGPHVFQLLKERREPPITSDVFWYSEKETQMQVVAGMNYRLVLYIPVDDLRVTVTYFVPLYKGLDEGTITNVTNESIAWQRHQEMNVRSLLAAYGIETARVQPAEYSIANGYRVVLLKLTEPTTEMFLYAMGYIDAHNSIAFQKIYGKKGDEVIEQ